MKLSVKPVAIAVGAACAGSMLLTQSAIAAGTPFSLTELNSGYMQPVCNLHGEHKGREGKCGAGKCGGDMKGKEGKCGAGKCGGDMKGKEGKCGAGKCGGDMKGKEGKCGAGKCGGDSKGSEGKCGAGKCGGAT